MLPPAFRKLARHEIRHWALTGGFAFEIHAERLGLQPSVRALNDLDFIAPSFDYIPGTLPRDFLFRHIHPLDPPGKVAAGSYRRRPGAIQARARLSSLCRTGGLGGGGHRLAGSPQAGAPCDIFPDQQCRSGFDSGSSRPVDHSRILEEHSGTVPALCAYRRFSLG
jgi:hypothetical protein